MNTHGNSEVKNNYSIKKCLQFDKFNLMEKETFKDNDRDSSNGNEITIFSESKMEERQINDSGTFNGRYFISP